MRQIAEEQEAAGEPGDAVRAAEPVVEDDGRGEAAGEARRDRMPDAAMHREAMEERMHSVAHQQQRPDPQEPHLGDRQARGEVEQHREREEYREACEQGAARARILEVDIGQHRSERAGHRHGDEVLRRDDVGRERQGRKASRHDGPDDDVRGEIGHGTCPPARHEPRAAQRCAEPSLPPHQIRGPRAIERGSASVEKAAAAHSLARLFPALRPRAPAPIDDR